MRGYHIAIFFILSTLWIHPVAALTSPNSCEVSVSDECLLETSFQFIMGATSENKLHTILRFIAISAALNKPVPIDIYEFIPTADLPFADDFYYAGRSLYFGINGNEQLWKRYASMSYSNLTKQWSNSFYVRYLAINAKNKDPFIESLLSNGIDGYTPLVEAKTYYGLNTDNSLIIDSLIRDIINSDIDSRDKLQQLFSVIAVCITIKEVGHANTIFSIAENNYSSSIFWDSFSSAVSALHATATMADHSYYLSMIEDTRFKAIVYSSLLDIHVNSQNAQGLELLMKDILSYLYSTKETLDSNTAAILALKIISLIYLI
jgi:hypothetical protein